MATVLKKHPLFEAYKSFFDYNYDACFAMNTSGNVILFNDAAAEITGYTRKEIIEKPISLLFTEEHSANFYRNVSTECKKQFSVNILHKNGHGVELDMTVIPIFIEHDLQGFIAIARDITDIQHFETKLKGQGQIFEMIYFMAFHDEVTGLPNRKKFEENVHAAIERHSSHPGKMFAVMYLELGRFKHIRESLGQNFSDVLLKKAALQLSGMMEEKQDTIYRWGEDEFIILLEDITETEVRSYAERLLGSLSEPLSISGQEIFLTPSIGISLFPSDGDQADELLRKADLAMYAVIKEGRSSYQFFHSALEQETQESFKIENYLRKALVNDEFSLHFQPIIDLLTHRISAVEALLRWNNPALGNVTPNRFIPIAEETGMILPIGEWVLKEACRQMKIWQMQGITIPSVAVNISIRQFKQPGLVRMIEEILQETGLEPNCLTIEITESMTTDVEAAKGILNELKKLGVNISIDDFGTGYSSFNYIKKFPIDNLKIDKTFISDITKSKDDETLTTGILLMAQKLGLNVIAEGVETKEQLGVLVDHQCRNAQGFLFSKPMQAESLTAMLAKPSLRQIE